MTSIPPTKIKNRIYENQKCKHIIPVNIAVNVVCRIRINPMAKGWFSWINTRDIMIIIIVVNNINITGSSLFKI